MTRWLQMDERTEQVSGRLAFVFLGLTQAGLLVGIVVQRYAQGLSPSYYNDLAAILAYSVLGFWGMSLFLGGVLPQLNAKVLITAYLFLSLSIGIPHLLIRGLPMAGVGVRWLLVVFGAPAVLVGGYSLVAYLGKKRLDRLIEMEADTH
jgi:FtsH-binding integral membrane protein